MTVDLRRRQKVMTRSQALQHCVCDPQKNCPCDIFIDYNVCTCAGEKMPAPARPAALTRTVRSAGCASKIAQGDLVRILRNLPAISDPRILLGAAAGDDCGVYLLDNGLALVQTVDVFTPCVDDPYLFGQIAAANSLSDIYAMGGRPLTALSVVGFPMDDLDGGILEAMLTGGIDKLNEAGCALIGGHSMNDRETKMGFAVTGVMESARVVQRDRARAGDALVLTKPLGTGMIAFGAQIGRLPQGCLEDAGTSMTTLNRDAAELMHEFQVHACTDVTGFGLAGHLVEMMRTSDVSAEIDIARIPVFAGVPFCLENEILPGAIERNQEYAMAWVRGADPGVQKLLPLLYDPQTSGGLLLALPEEKAAEYVAALHRRGHRAAAVIGRIIEKSGPESEIVILHPAEQGPLPPCRDLYGDAGASLGETGMPFSPANSKEATMPTPPEPQKGAGDPASGLPSSPESPCCASPPALEEDPSAANPVDLFKDFMKAANQPGLIDRRAKKLMAVALSVVQRCAPCLKSHMKSALAMGISRAELDEAAQLAISFGGCTVMMFYGEICDELNP
jgi:selenide,water dikinase